MSSAHHHADHDIVHDRRVLYIVLALNFSLFVLEFWQGLVADSTSLIADSMDFLSDSVSYLITLYVLTKALSVRARASIIKASLMLMLAVAALAQGAHNIMVHETPHYTTMGWVSLLAFMANAISAALLFGSRNRDSNMRSIWLCSRNDVLSNLAIMIAAYLVYVTDTLWPDVCVALVIMWLEGGSAIKIIAHAKEELRHDH